MSDYGPKKPFRPLRPHLPPPPSSPRPAGYPMDQRPLLRQGLVMTPRLQRRVDPDKVRQQTALPSRESPTE